LGTPWSQNCCRNLASTAPISLDTEILVVRALHRTGSAIDPILRVVANAERMGDRAATQVRPLQSAATTARSLIKPTLQQQHSRTVSRCVDTARQTFPFRALTSNVGEAAMAVSHNEPPKVRRQQRLFALDHGSHGITLGRSGRIMLVLLLGYSLAPTDALNCDTHTCDGMLHLIDAAATTVCPPATCDDATCCELVASNIGCDAMSKQLVIRVRYMSSSFLFRRHCLWYWLSAAHTRQRYSKRIWDLVAM
jgi:hypothetical protein